MSNDILGNFHFYFACSVLSESQLIDGVCGSGRNIND